MNSEIYEDDEGYYNGKGNKLMNVAQVREQLPLSRARIYQLINSGELPAVQVGRRVMVAEGDLWEFIADHRKPEF
jgi:excisionase family DNA binding protein